MNNSKQRDLERKRAKSAWTVVDGIRHDKDLLKEYASLAKSAPADIMSNGLGQTLAFWRAKGMENGKPKKNGNTGHWKIYSQVSEWVVKEMSITHRSSLLGWIMSEGIQDEGQYTNTADYRRATGEAIAFLIWVKRFVEAEAE